MTEEQLKEIEARANAATPGPWKVEWDYNGLRVSEGESKEDYWDTFANDDVDLPFMSHAREDIPKLLAEVRRLRAQRKVYVVSIQTSDQYGTSRVGGVFLTLGAAEKAFPKERTFLDEFILEGEVK